MLVILSGTHGYPGCRAVLSAGQPRGAGDAIVAFADGTHVPTAVGDVTEGGFSLAIPAYRTARGTAIAAKSWRLGRDERGWKIIGRT